MSTPTKPPTMRPELREAIERLTDDAVEAIGSGELEPMLRLWHQCQLMASELADLAAEISDAAVPLMPWETTPRGKRAPTPVVVDGIGSIEVHPGGRYTVWDIESASKAIIRKAMDAGEIQHPLDVANVLRRCAGGGLQYFKVTEMKALDIDVEEHRVVDYGRSKLRAVS